MAYGNGGGRMKDYKSCPFCSSMSMKMCGDNETNWYVICKTCGAYGPIAGTTEIAKRLWNERTIL